MTPNERKAELTRAGKRVIDLAHALDVHISHVSHVLLGRRRSARIEQAIADAIGRPVDEVFEPVPPKSTAAA